MLVTAIRLTIAIVLLAVFAFVGWKIVCGCFGLNKSEADAPSETTPDDDEKAPDN